jgi:hypothetical protein
VYIVLSTPCVPLHVRDIMYGVPATKRISAQKFKILLIPRRDSNMSDTDRGFCSHIIEHLSILN